MKLEGGLLYLGHSVYSQYMFCIFSEHHVQFGKLCSGNSVQLFSFCQFVC